VRVAANELAQPTNGWFIMTETTVLIVFVAVTSIAVVMQALMMAGMYATTRKMSERMNRMQQRVNDEVLPLVVKVRGMVDENAPMIHTAIVNLSETTGMVRAQAEKIDVAVTEIVEIARTQAGNAGVLASRTMERVDITAGTIQHAVTSPVRHLSALVNGVMAGFGEFVAGRKVRRTRPVPSDEMFI
jgi:hypothetical protein